MDVNTGPDHVVQAEMSVVGAILIDSTDGSTMVVSGCRDLIAPPDFHDKRAARIYSAMLEVAVPHQINVGRYLHEQGRLANGDIPYMSLCIADCPTHLAWKSFAEAVLAYARQRRGEKARPVIQRAKTVGGITLE